jgi:OOP family OmpA-OmpF porin
MICHKHVHAIVGLGLLAGLLAGCSSSSGASKGASGTSVDASLGTGGLAIVVGMHANAPTPSVPAEVLQLIDQALLDQSQIALVTNEGKARGQTFQLPLTAKNALSKKQQLATYRAQILGGIATMRARTPQNDLLDAIDEAGRRIASVKGQRTIAVIDSGLQTISPLRFQEAGMLEADPSDVGDFLKHAGDLPNLAGDKVLLIGFGDTAPPQVSLAVAQRSNVQAIWSEVLTAAGATVTVGAAPITGDSATGLPIVATVAIKSPADFAVAVVAPKKTVSIQLTQDAVGFRPSTADFADRSAADRVLRPLAKQIRAQHLKVHLVGSTATHGTMASQRKLSKERADAVKQRLVNLGVSAGAITTEGVGSAGPGHISDVSPSGGLLAGPAARNRKVTVELSHA